MRDSESPVSPSGSNASKNTTTTTSSSASPLPPPLLLLSSATTSGHHPQHQQQQPSPLQSQQQQQIFPIRSPSLNTTSLTSNNNSSVKKLFSKATNATKTTATEAPLSARAQLLTSSHVQLPSHQRLVQIHSLTKDMLAISVEQKCQVWDIYHCCCSHLGIDDARILGLAIRAPSEGIGSDRPRHEYFFLQNDQKVAKYLPKQSRFSKVCIFYKLRVL
uniref:FERM domain-containing protein n=1 Tax=Panagrolaimus sp. ES5 TaxID=591445 RepID=A0AC34G1S2_9BILA